MKIAITGATGFLGGSLKEFLNLNDHTVLGISTKDDNFITKVSEFKPDVFIHCAWIGGSSYGDTQDLIQYENISDGVKVFKALNKNKKVKFIGFGSFSEYGIVDDVIEESFLENPSSLYGISKNSFKEMSKSFCDFKNFDWLWIRPCYIYGPNDVATRLIPKVIKDCLEKKEVVLNSCQSVVDYLYIDDFVRAIHELIVQNKHGVYNICSGEQYIVKDIVSHIGDICNFNNITYDSKRDRVNFPKKICGSRQKLTFETGWKPEVEIVDGLKKTIEHKRKLSNFL